jgi:branched-subunit amino acid ABC-type transport system permease component
MGLGTLVLGLINGATIGLLAAGFVLVYKSNRFLNLAHAQLGAVSAMLLAKLCIDGGWNFWPALAVCLLLGVGVGPSWSASSLHPCVARRPRRSDSFCCLWESPSSCSR